MNDSKDASGAADVTGAMTEPERAPQAGGPEAAHGGLHDDGRSETPTERADRNWNELLQEARVTQTCTQILGGFLLAVAFQPRFEDLDEYQLTLYLVLVALAGIATALALGLVMLHRRYFGRRQKVRVALTGDRLLKANLVVVAVLTAGVTSLIFDLVLGRTAGWIALAVGLVLGLGLAAFTPLASPREQRGDSRHGAPGAGATTVGEAVASERAG